MTDLRQAAQQALEALEELDGLDTETECVTIDVGEVITALREALEQPAQEPMHPELRKMWEDHFDKCFRTQPEQEPVAYYHPHKSFYWAKPTHISAPTVVDVPPVPLYVKWIAAQHPWQGLTDEEVQFYIKKHSKLVNAGYDKLTDTNLVAKTFDSTGFYKEVSTALKERNNG